MHVSLLHPDLANAANSTRPSEATTGLRITADDREHGVERGPSALFRLTAGS
jgi:hypothetical protein